MAVRLYCSICEKFVKRLTEIETKKITGKELCDDCSKKIADIYANLDSAEAKYQKEVRDKFVDLSQEFVSVQKFKEQNVSQVKIILAGIRPQIEEMVKEIFRERDEKK